MIAKPGSIKPHKKFKGEVYVLSKDEGGRHTPFFKGYRPQFYFRTTDVTGVAQLPEGMEMVMPGDNVSLEVELITPVAMDKGLRFAIREGGRTVGAGTVTEIVRIGVEATYGTRTNYIAVHRVQAQELHQHEEQEDHDGAAGAEEVLPVLPQAPRAQGDQVGWLVKCTLRTGSTCRGVGLTADQRSPKPRVGVRIPPPLPAPSGGLRDRRESIEFQGANMMAKN